MITNIRIRDFKKLEEAEFNLGGAPVVLVGPNNGGKTSILQALTMWHHGVEEWCQHFTHRRKEGSNQPRGVSISLNEFHALTADDAKEIWREKRVSSGRGGSDAFQQVKIGIDVCGISGKEGWDIKTEFIYRARPAVSCGPSVDGFREGESPADVAARWQRFLPRVAFLQPMSGMSEAEDVFGEIGSLNDRLGKGKTADVLRNICYLLAPPKGKVDDEEWERGQILWERLAGIIGRKFPGVLLNSPEKDPRGKGKIKLTYREGGKEYDLSSGGRGFHQTLLLLAFLYWNPGAVVLLDEPDAHLEVVRQQDNFSMYSEVAEELGSQLIIASHSEVVMRQASPGAVVKVVEGATKPLNSGHDISQFAKVLTTIGADKVAQAMIHEHVVFLEGRSDREFLAAFAEILFGVRNKLFGVRMAEKIRRINLEPVGGNDVKKARDLFHGLNSAVPNLRGFALFDRDVEGKMQGDAANEARREGLTLECWRRREVENYLLLPDVLRRHAQKQQDGALFMEKAITRNTAPSELENPGDSKWSDNSMKEYIRKVFAEFRKKAGGGPWDDSRCYTLVQHMEPDEIPDEVREKILAVLKVIDPDFDPEESEFSGEKG